MDDTTEGPADQTAGDDSEELERLKNADPAESPPIAEAIADELQRALDETGEGR